MLEQAMTMQAAQQLMQQAVIQFQQGQLEYPVIVEQAMMMGTQPPPMPQQPTPDQIMAQAIGQTQQQLSQMLAPVLQALAQIQPEIQKRMPQPPMPPEVQATLQIAQMENQRRTQLDQATLQQKQVEHEADQQKSAIEFQAEQQQQQFDQMMEKLTAQFSQQLESAKLTQETQYKNMENELKARNDQLVHQIDLIKNKADNDQKQMTELLKNRDDNETKKEIEMLRGQLTAMSQTSTTPAQALSFDFTEQFKSIAEMLNELGTQKLEAAMTPITEKLQATLEHIAAPSEIVRDTKTGKALGIRKVTQH